MIHFLDKYCMRFYCDANFCFIQCVNVTKVPDFFIYDLSETFFKKGGKCDGENLLVRKQERRKQYYGLLKICV